MLYLLKESQGDPQVGKTLHSKLVRLMRAF